MKVRTMLMVTLVSFLVSCSKTKGPTGGLPTNPNSFSGIFLTEKDGSNYNYLADAGFISLFRLTVPKNYPLSDLKNEKDCYFFADWKGAQGNHWHVSSKKEKNIFWRVYKSAADNKWAVGLEDVPGVFPSPDPNDATYQFVFHTLGKENGMDVVAIESKSAPGYFISNTGLPINAVNAASLTQHNKPEEATRFYVGKP